MPAPAIYAVDAFLVEHLGDLPVAGAVGIYHAHAFHISEPACNDDPLERENGIYH
jgi:hypothetical protein